VPFPIGLGKSIELTEGDELVIAPGIGRLGPDQGDSGVASAVAAPSAATTPAAVAAVASLAMGRLNIELPHDSSASESACLKARHGKPGSGR
jgi:hypothetical protein